jgi:hypothetical protein
MRGVGDILEVEGGVKEGAGAVGSLLGSDEDLEILLRQREKAKRVKEGQDDDGMWMAWPIKGARK